MIGITVQFHQSNISHVMHSVKLASKLVSKFVTWSHDLTASRRPGSEVHASSNDAIEEAAGTWASQGICPRSSVRPCRNSYVQNRRVKMKARAGHLLLTRGVVDRVDVRLLQHSEDQLTNGRAVRVGPTEEHGYL